MIGEGVCGAVGGMKIGKGNWSTRRKPAPAPLCPPQIPLDQTPRSNPGRRGGKPATNRLSYGAALIGILTAPLPRIGRLIYPPYASAGSCLPSLCIQMYICEPHRKHFLCLQKYLFIVSLPSMPFYCWVCNFGNLFTEPLPSNCDMSHSIISTLWGQI
jgi:hypothetical protein